MQTNTDLKRELQDLRALAKQLTEHKAEPTRTKNKNTWKYCWTHGACAHKSTACTAKADGHQDASTFADRMGGSDRRLSIANKE